MVFKFLKALLLVVLIFGALYFGLSYYFSLKTAVVPEKASKNAEELKVLREELTILEQKIQDQKREERPVEDEEEAVANLRGNIDRVKKLIAAEMPAERPVADKPSPAIPSSTLFSDKYQKVFIAAIGLLLLALLITLFLRRAMVSPQSRPGQRKVRPLPEAPLPRPQEGRPPQAAPSELAEQKLKETLEKFRNLSPEIKRTETRELPLSGTREAVGAARPEPSPEAPPPDLKRIFAEKDPPGETPAKEGPAGGSLVEKVFALSKKGQTVEEISEQVHIDQDQVRLILRFKQ